MPHETSYDLKIRFILTKNQDLMKRPKTTKYSMIVTFTWEKTFDSIFDLVHDGLISFYIEKHASYYIALIAKENNYAESPYVASRTALLVRQKRYRISFHPSPSPPRYMLLFKSIISINKFLKNPKTHILNIRHNHIAIN